MSFEDRLKSLGNEARQEAGPPIDVRARVMATIATRRAYRRLDLAQVVMAAAAVVAGIVALIVGASSWQVINEPWIGLFP